MKKRTAALFIALLATRVSAACPKGSIEWEGSCAVDVQPADGAKGSDNVSWVSNAKPPKTTTGEWQTGKFEIVNISPQTDVQSEIDTKHKWDAAHGIHDDPPRGTEQ